MPNQVRLYCPVQTVGSSNPVYVDSYLTGIGDTVYAQISEPISVNLFVTFGYMENDEFGSVFGSIQTVINAGQTQSEYLYMGNRTDISIMQTNPTEIDGRPIVINSNYVS